VATYSQGCVVSFPGATFAEVISVSMDRGGSMPIGRDSNATGYAQDYGTVTVEALGGSYTYGAYGTLTISGGGIGLTEKAVCTGVSATAQANDVTRYSVTFALIA
jgi:hypothetical protein